ncbi:MAG: hypothetical protein ABH856_04130 [Patescibacteria group bacterium]
MVQKKEKPVVAPEPQLSKYGQKKIEELEEVLDKESKDSYRYIKSRISAYVRKTEALDWEMLNPMKLAISNIYKESTIEQRRTIIQKSTVNELAMLKGEVTGSDIDTEDLDPYIIETRRKAMHVTGYLKGWVKATIESFDVQGPEAGKITLEILQNLSNMLPAVGEMMKTSDEGRDRVFNKLLTSAKSGTVERLDAADYEYVAAMIESSNGLNKKSKEAMQGGIIGTLISMMTPVEREKTVRAFIEKGNDGKELVEALVATDMLSMDQGRKIFFEYYNVDQFREEKLGKQQEAARKLFRKQAMGLESNYSSNPAAYFSRGDRLLYVAAGVAGVATTVLNSLMYVVGKDKDLGGLIANPYVWLGVGGMALSASGLSGNRVTSLISNKETREGSPDYIKEREQKLAKVFGAHPEVLKYLEEGGFETFIKVYDERKKARTDYQKTSGKAPKGDMFGSTTELVKVLEEKETKDSARNNLKAVKSARGGKAALAEALVLTEQLRILTPDNFMVRLIAMRGQIEDYKHKHRA